MIDGDEFSPGHVVKAILMVAMVSKMLKNYNYIVQTVLFLALAIGTQGKAETALSPYIFDNSTAECAEDGSYSKRDELMDYLGTYSGLACYSISKFHVSSIG